MLRLTLTAAALLGLAAIPGFAAAAPLPSDVPQHLYEDCQAMLGPEVGQACFGVYLVAVHACAVLAVFTPLGGIVPAEVWAVCFAP